MTNRSYAFPLTLEFDMTISRMLVLAAISRRRLAAVLDRYRGVPELVTPRFRGHRIIRDRAWRRHRRRRASVEHVIARLKNWRVLRDHRRRGRHLDETLQAVSFLHNLQVDLWDSP
jgi:hypothetical protein